VVSSLFLSVFPSPLLFSCFSSSFHISLSNGLRGTTSVDLHSCMYGDNDVTKRFPSGFSSRPDVHRNFNINSIYWNSNDFTDLLGSFLPQIQRQYKGYEIWQQSENFCTKCHFSTIKSLAAM